MKLVEDRFAGFGARVTIAVCMAAVFLIFLGLFAAPAEAQKKGKSKISWKAESASSSEFSDRQAQQVAPDDARGPLAGEIVDAQDTDDSDVVDLATIEVAGCEIDSAGATISIEDSDGTTGLLADGANVEITATESEITIVGTGPDNDIFFGTVGGEGNSFEGDATVLSSTGITCQGVELPPNNDDDQYSDDDQYDDELPDAAEETEDPGDADVPDDVIDETIPDQPLPDTGGLPLVGLVVLGLALLGVGSSVVRAGIGRRP